MPMIETFALVTLVFAIISTVFYLRNFFAFRAAPRVSASADDMPCVSVLIPARDEADRIRPAVESVLANTGVRFEVVVLDDQSQDETPQIVSEMARDDRVRLVQGKKLPSGWCGKQHACQQLSQHAKYDELLFIDADVTLAPDAVRRCVAFKAASGAELVSGFPRQVVRTLGEALLVPLVHIVLLTYLPFHVMRRTLSTAASAGCGQMFLTSRAAYERAGGHAAIRSSMHDGVTLPRAYRRAGLASDVFDASDLARCRMYRGWSETVRGVLKNAHEGIANGRLIVPATSLMVLGYLAPTLLAVGQLIQPGSARTLAIAFSAAAISYIPRVLSAIRFDRAWLATVMFPFSILLFVALQWVAFFRNLAGTKSTWRGRAYEITTS